MGTTRKQWDRNPAVMYSLTALDWSRDRPARNPALSDDPGNVLESVLSLVIAHTNLIPIP